MKISKKLFAVLLAVILAFSVVAVGASAAGTAKGDEWMTVTLSTDKGAESYEAGDTVVVTVSIACNYNVPTFRFPILFDKSVIEQKPNIAMVAANTCTTGSLRNNVNPGEEVFPQAYSADDWGCILFQWTADVQGGAIGCINNPEGEAVFSFELKVKQGATGTGTILIPSESDLLYYMAYEDSSIATSDYYMNAETCAMTFIPANVSVAVPDVKLIPNEDYDSTAIVDEENLFVYGLKLGIETSAEIKEYVKATGGATIRTTPTAEEIYGTGATISLSLSGVPVKAYTIVILGDLNGDADVSALDTARVIGYIGGSLSLSKELMLAGDVGNFDGDVDPIDTATIIGAISGGITINQQGPAAV